MLLKGQFKITLEGEAYAIGETSAKAHVIDMAKFCFRSKRVSRAETNALIE